jgi:hypothetical protein
MVAPRILRPFCARAAVALALVSASAGCTPELGESTPATKLFTDAKLSGKYVTVTAVLGVSGGIMGSTSCSKGRCDLEISPPDAGWKPPKGVTSTAKASFSVGSGENEMAELPDKYAKSDVKVKAMGGKVLKVGDKVKLSGNLHCLNGGNQDSLPCSIYVKRIDAP